MLVKCRCELSTVGYLEARIITSISLHAVAKRGEAAFASNRIHRKFQWSLAITNYHHYHHQRESDKDFRSQALRDLSTTSQNSFAYML